MKKLRLQSKESARHAFADSTYKNLKIQLETYFLFCFYFNFDAIPTSVLVLSLYAQFLSRSFATVDSIKNYISAVKTLHLLLTENTEAFDSLYLKLIFRGLLRIKSHCPKQAMPITPQILCDFRSKFDMKCAIDSTFWCLFLHAFFLMFRKSNLVPVSVSSFDSNKQLCRKNYTYDILNNVLLVRVKWSKTNQYGEREIIIPLVRISGSPLCPVQAFLHMISLVDVPEDSPAFCIVKKGKIYPIIYSQFQKRLKNTISDIGLNPDNFSSHSFRRGGASWAFASNVPSELIQLYGDWKSDAYKRYLKFDLFDKITVANSMSSHILKLF